MHFHVITLFPEMVGHLTQEGVLGRAIKQGIIGLTCWNPRDYTQDKHRTVDDRPYGGGPGMLMKVQPLADAIDAARQAAGESAKVIYMSPQGSRLNQQRVRRLAHDCIEDTASSLILIAGRYEGIDERLMETMVDREISIGDYVLSGGELPAMVLMDGITRLIPGVVGDAASVERDSFSDGLLNYPQYTRPEEIDGLPVPEVLLSGDHAKIARWRRMQALGRTLEKRPDLLEAADLSDEDRQLLDQHLALRGRTKEET